MNEEQKEAVQKMNVYDKNGWADSRLYKPVEFDLVEVCDSNGKRQLGWWTGGIWEYGFKRVNDNIIKWKRRPDYLKLGK